MTKTADFIHLHNHSEYSLLDGLSKISDILAKAKAYKMDSVAITDHGVMYGAIKFYLAARDMKIKPIIGVEAYMARRSRLDKEARIDSDQTHLLLLAKNFDGYKNLMKLTSIAHLEGFYYKPRIDFEVLEKYSKGLIATSACVEGIVPYYLRIGEDETAYTHAKRLAEIFGNDHFYLEIQKHKFEEQDRVNEKLIRMSKKLGIPLVAANDCHYVNREDALAQEALLCIQTQTFLNDKDRKLTMIDSPDFYFRSPNEMKELFIEYPEAIKNTVKISEMCNLEIPMEKWILPAFPIPTKETPESYLRKVALDGLKKRYKKLDSALKKRLEYEINVICKKGFATYFLIVADFVNWAKEQGIRVGPGRGSVSGSLVSYSMRITSVDPIEHNLPFERFLNPARPSPPDIDLDFADIRRDEVIAYVTGKYGEDKVAQIITFGSMEARQAIRDVGRVMGLPYSYPDRVAKMVPLASQGFAMSIERAMNLNSELGQLYKTDETAKKLLDLAIKLEGVSRHASTHAAGVVIADKPLTEYTPLQKEAKGEKIVTQYDMYSLDLNVAGVGRAVGLLKMDFLGLRNLTILEKALDYVEEIRGRKIDISDVSLDDKEVYKMISSGETTGVFQLESAGMRRLARKLKPAKFSDLAAMVALYRPGPMDWIDDFIRGKNNPRSVVYPHKDLRPVLSETYGIAVYQEQCMEIANVMAGYSMAEADILRRGIGKKKQELFEKERNKFVKGAVGKGYKKKVAEKVFSLIEKFSGYGFNKAHAAGYAMISYQTAYMKTKYTVEFMAAVLTAESGAASGPIRDEKLARAVKECKRMKIEVFPPDINLSEAGFTIEKPDGKYGIRFGLSAIKNLGTAAISSILRARKEGKFKSIADFCLRVDLAKVNKKTLESLIKAGAMDRFGRRSAMLAGIDKILDQMHREKKRQASGQTSLFEQGGKKIIDDLNSLDLPNIDEIPKKQLLAYEKQFLGLYLTEHPLANVLKYLEEKTDESFNSLTPDFHLGKVLRLGGIITNVRVIRTRRLNAEMAFIRIEDNLGSGEVVVFPKIFSQTREIWVNDQAVLIRGRVGEKEEKISVIVESAYKVDEESLKSKSEVIYEGESDYEVETKKKEENTNSGCLVIVIKEKKLIKILIGGRVGKEKLKKLKGFLEKSAGSYQVVLYILNGDQPREVKTNFTIEPASGLIRQIETILSE